MTHGGAATILPSKNNFVKALLKLHPEITTVVINVNNRNTSMVLGDKEHVIYGKGYIEDELCGKRFRISPKSFYQVNPVQTEILYGKALEYAGLTGKETVVDAYCGTGTIGMIASDKAGKVIGVELNADAVRDARNNAKANQIRNIQFYQNDAGKFLVEMAGQGAKVDVVLMDPQKRQHRRIHELRSPDRPGTNRLRLLQSRDTGQGSVSILRRKDTVWRRA